MPKRFHCRLLLCQFILAVVLVFALSWQHANAEQIRLRFANFPAAGTFPCVSMERWADEIQKRTNGAVLIETYPGGTLLEAKNMLRGVMKGQSDIGCISLSYHPGAFPLLSAFELPLGFESAESASVVLWKMHSLYNPGETSKYKVIAMFTSAPSQIMSTGEVKTAEDLGGLMLRASGTLADVVQHFGASPVSMPQSDTPEALQKGVVQGVFTSFDVLKDYNFAESCRYGLVIDGPVYPFMIFMNLKKWESLPKDVQDAIMALAPEHSAWTGRYVDAHGREAVEWAVKTHNFSLAVLDSAQMESLRAKAAPVIAKWLENAKDKDIDGEAFLKQIADARNQEADGNRAADSASKGE